MVIINKSHKLEILFFSGLVAISLVILPAAFEERNPPYHIYGGMTFFPWLVAYSYHLGCLTVSIVWAAVRRKFSILIPVVWFGVFTLLLLRWMLYSTGLPTL